MRSLGIEPNKYLLSNILWAHLIGMPVLIFVNFLCSRLASLVIFAAIKPEYSRALKSNMSEFVFLSSVVLNSKDDVRRETSLAVSDFDRLESQSG